MASPKSLRVLMVDDDREDAFLMRRALSKTDASVDFSHEFDSVDFVEKLGVETGPDHICADVVLLDLNMPRMNGFEVLKSIKSKSDYKNTKVIMLTTSESADDKSEALRLGADRFVSKPSTSDGLAKFVQALVQDALGIRR